MTETVPHITQPVYQAIVGKLIAIENCARSGNPWLANHEAALTTLMDSAPSGSGIDCGVSLLRDECKCERLVFSCDFHHMNEHGYYDGWTHHKAIVTPSLFGRISIRITGRNRNDIKEYLGDVLRQ